MTTKRKDERTISCELSREEALYMYDVDITEDPANISAALQEHILDIATECYSLENVDFESNRPYSIHMAIPPNKESIVLDFSYGQAPMPSFLGGILNAIAQAVYPDGALANEELAEQEIEEEAKAQEETEDVKELSVENIYQFDTLQSVIKFASAIDSDTESSLIKYNDKYIIRLKGSPALSLIAAEFCGVKPDVSSEFLNEYGNVVISDNAIKKLSSL